MSTVVEVERVRRSIRERIDEPDSSGRLRIDVDRVGPAVTLHARGELDAYTLPVWRSVMREATALTTSPRPVIVDISRLDFIACGALVALALDGDVCRVHGVDLILVTRASTVPRAVAAAGLATRLPIYTTMETALLALQPENAPEAPSIGFEPPGSGES